MLVTISRIECTINSVMARLSHTVTTLAFGLERCELASVTRFLKSVWNIQNIVMQRSCSECLFWVRPSVGQNSFRESSAPLRMKETGEGRKKRKKEKKKRRRKRTRTRGLERYQSGLCVLSEPPFNLCAFSFFLSSFVPCVFLSFFFSLLSGLGVLCVRTFRPFTHELKTFVHVSLGLKIRPLCRLRQF